MRCSTLTLLALLSSLPAAAQIGPTTLYAVQSGADVLLQWNSNPGDTYTVFRTADLSQPFVAIGAGPPPFFDPGAVPGPPMNPDRYYYYLETVDAMSNRWASNLAFKINIALEPGTTPFGNAVSLPYFFFPHGSIGMPADASDICRAYPFVKRFLRYPAAPCGGLPVFRTCAASVPVFPITPGDGFWIVVDAPAVLDVVGAHDDQFAANKGSTLQLVPPSCATCELAERLVSVPYHALAATAEEACAEMAAFGAPAAAILDFHKPTERFLRHRCGTPTFDFSLEPGRGYIIEAESIDARWSPNVF